jgi:hypothetical protein
VISSVVVSPVPADLTHPTRVLPPPVRVSFLSTNPLSLTEGFDIKALPLTVDKLQVKLSRVTVPIKLLVNDVPVSIDGCIIYPLQKNRLDPVEAVPSIKVFLVLCTGWYFCVVSYHVITILYTGIVEGGG